MIFILVFFFLKKLRWKTFFFVCLMIIRHINFRFDQSTVELLLWYEAIFGREMWKHVITETTFWSHSQDAVDKRWRERGQVKYSKGFKIEGLGNGKTCSKNELMRVIFDKWTHFLVFVFILFLFIFCNYP
jgi:hypothetical protein